MNPEKIKQAADSFTEVPVIQAGKRCGSQWAPWMGDWFTSWSPRNANSNAEGPWAHWVDLAVPILRDPMTAIVRPDAHEVAQKLEPRRFYSEADRCLTEAELLQRFANEGVAEYPEPDFHHRAYGVDVTWMGEDGGMAARGHVPDLRFIAACNHLARKDAGLRNIWDDPSALLDDALGLITRVWAIPADPSTYGEGGWAVTWHDITEQTPGAFPLTVMLP